MKLQLVDRRTRPDTEPAALGLAAGGRLWSRLTALCEPLGEPGWTADLVLVDDDLIRQLNLRWRGIDAATDVLSFSYLAHSGGGLPAVTAGNRYAYADLWLEPQETDAGESIVGEIVIAPRWVRTKCRQLGADPEAELALLALHGGLHLLGWRHDDARQRTAMQEVEAELLSRQGVDHPLAQKE
jgi:probable rRNA maturation factor